MAGGHDVILYLCTTLGMALILIGFIGILIHKYRKDKRLVQRHLAEQQARIDQVQAMNLPPLYCDAALDPVVVYDFEHRELVNLRWGLEPSGLPRSATVSPTSITGPEVSADLASLSSSSSPSPPPLPLSPPPAEQSDSVDHNANGNRSSPAEEIAAPTATESGTPAVEGGAISDPQSQPPVPPLAVPAPVATTYTAPWEMVIDPDRDPIASPLMPTLTHSSTAAVSSIPATGTGAGRQPLSPPAVSPAVFGASSLSQFTVRNYSRSRTNSLNTRSQNGQVNHNNSNNRNTLGGIINRNRSATTSSVLPAGRETRGSTSSTSTSSTATTAATTTTLSGGAFLHGSTSPLMSTTIRMIEDPHLARMQLSNASTTSLPPRPLPAAVLEMVATTNSISPEVLSSPRVHGRIWFQASPLVIPYQPPTLEGDDDDYSIQELLVQDSEQSSETQQQQQQQIQRPNSMQASRTAARARAPTTTSWTRNRSASSAAAINVGSGSSSLSSPPSTTLSSTRARTVISTSSAAPILNTPASAQSLPVLATTPSSAASTRSRSPSGHSRRQSYGHNPLSAFRIRSSTLEMTPVDHQHQQLSSLSLTSRSRGSHQRSISATTAAARAILAADQEVEGVVSQLVIQDNNNNHHDDEDSTPAPAYDIPPMSLALSSPPTYDEYLSVTAATDTSSM